MKLIKILLIACILLPMSANAQSKAKKSTPKARTEQTVDLYPMFDTKEAAQLWHKWVVKETFTQEEFARVLDLCNTAYDYLNEDINRFLGQNPTKEHKRRHVLDLDQGKTSEMTNFVRSFSNNLQNLAAAGQFDNTNIEKVVAMIEKKNEYKRLFGMLYHS